MAGSSTDHLVESKRAAGLVEPKMWAKLNDKLNEDRIVKRMDKKEEKEEK